MDAPEKEDGALRGAPVSEKLGLTQHNCGSAIVQHDVCRHNTTREVELLWLTAKTLVHIDDTLTDLQTLAQQQADLFRAILAVKRSAQ